MVGESLFEPTVESDGGITYVSVYQDRDDYEALYVACVSPAEREGDNGAGTGEAVVAKLDFRGAIRLYRTLGEWIDSKT